MSQSSRLNNTLKQRDFKLNALLELTEAINANWSEEELLYQFQNIVDVHLGISKFALLGFSKNLRLELKDKGIKVTAVCPGAVFTNSWAGSGVDPKRIMEANDIAEMIYASTQLSPQAVVEDIVMRPLLGDL